MSGEADLRPVSLAVMPKFISEGSVLKVICRHSALSWRNVVGEIVLRGYRGVIAELGIEA